MEIITYPGNKRVWKSLIVSKLNGVSVKEVTDVKMGETNKSSDFTAINPFGQVPTLKIESGKGVFESNSIARYLAREGEKKKSLLGKDHLEASRIDSFLDVIIGLESNGFPWVGKANKAPWAASIPRAAIANFEAQTKKIMSGFDKALDGHKWLVGDDISLADICWFCSSYPLFATVLDAEFRKTIPHAVAHFQKLEEIAEFKAVAGGAVKFPETAPVLVYEEHKEEKAPEVSLTYFPIRGRAESIRILLNATGTKYTECNPKDWPKEKVAGLESGLLPFGQMPLLKWGDFAIVQSNSILRFLGKKLNVFGSTDAEAAMVDQLCEAANDLRELYVRQIYEHKLEEKAKAEHKKWTLSHLANIEAILKRNKTDFIACSKLTIADATWFDVMDNNVRLYSDLLDSLPLLKAWYERFSALPNIKDYIGSDRRPKAVNANSLG